MEINIDINNIMPNINIKRNENEKIAIIGNNGAGKSILLKSLAGIYYPSKGIIKYDDKNCFKFPLNYIESWKWRTYVKNNVIYVDHTSLLYDHLTIKDNIRYFSSIGNLNEKEVFDDLKIYNLNESIEKPVKLLSDGTKQKILISLAMNSIKRFIILDEPDNNLDNSTISLMFNKIKSYKNKTIIISTHIEKNKLYDTFDYIYEIQK